MSDELTRILEIVLRDLNGRPAPVVDSRQWTDESGVVSAMLIDPTDGTGHGVFVTLSDPEPVRVANVADTVQEWVIEALWRRGRNALWPECPAHPNSHPLRPAVVGERAAWTCPKAGSVVADVGGLFPRRRVPAS